MVPPGVFLRSGNSLWSGAGSNRRPSAFQVNRAKRCADLRKRTSLTSGTALAEGALLTLAGHRSSTQVANATTGDRRSIGQQPLGGCPAHQPELQRQRG